MMTPEENTYRAGATITLQGVAVTALVTVLTAYEVVLLSFGEAIDRHAVLLDRLAHTTNPFQQARLKRLLQRSEQRIARRLATVKRTNAQVRAQYTHQGEH